MSDVAKNKRQTTSFIVEIDGISCGSFEDCEISPATAPVIKTRTGTDPNRFTVGLGIPEPQTIKLGKMSRQEDNAVIGNFADWKAHGERDKRGGRIDYLDAKTGEVYYRVTFTDAILSEFSAPKGDSVNGTDARFQFTITAPEVTEVTV